MKRVPPLPSLLVALLVLGALIAIWTWGVTSVRHLAANLVASYFLAWALVFVLSDATRSKLHGRFLLVTIALGLTFGLLEVASLTGLVDYRMLFGARGGEPWLAAGNRFDDELLFTREPGLVFERWRPRGNIAEELCLPEDETRRPVKITYDDRGFRNETTLSSAHLAIVGDSYIEAVDTPIEATLAHRVERSTGKTTVNLGRSGYGPQQELVVLERYALPLEPKTIVWAFYEGNDLDDLLEHDEWRARLDAGWRTTPTRFERTLAKNVLGALWRRLERCEPNPRAVLFMGTFHTRDGRDEQVYFVDGTDALDGWQIDALARFEAILRRAHDVTSERGVQLVLMFVPTKFRVYQDLVVWPALSVCGRWAGNDMPQRIAAIASRVSPTIGFLDLTPALRAGAARGERVYQARDTHWTPEGHRIAAAALVDHLRPREPGAFADASDVTASVASPL